MGKDLTGQKFGRLTVIERDPAKTSFWICRCDCGKIVSLYSTYFTSGERVDCGCGKKERSKMRSRKRMEREIGNRYGKLTVVAYNEEKSKPGYPCVDCVCDCGGKKTAFIGSLRQGLTRSCGCLVGENFRERSEREMIGKTYGWLTVERLAKPSEYDASIKGQGMTDKDAGELVSGITYGEAASNQSVDGLRSSGSGWSVKHGGLVWVCRCVCGNTVMVTTDRLNAGMNKSCGCMVEPDITGQKFGRLTVIKRAGKKQTGYDKAGNPVYNNLWLCQCECGNTKEVTTGLLRKGFVKSCGCLPRDKAKEVAPVVGRMMAENAIMDKSNVNKLFSDRKPSTNTSGYLGASYDKSRNAWNAQITFQGRHYYLGRYPTAEQAGKAYRYAQDILHGQFVEEHKDELVEEDGRYRKKDIVSYDDVKKMLSDVKLRIRKEEEGEEEGEEQK